MQDRWWRTINDVHVVLEYKIWFSRTKQKRTSPLFHNFMFIFISIKTLEPFSLVPKK